MTSIKARLNCSYTRGMAFVDMCYLRKENISGNMLVYRRRTCIWQALAIR